MDTAIALRARRLLMAERDAISGRRHERPVVERFADPMDDALAQQETHRIAGERERDTRMLHEIDAALDRVKNKVYGQCERCDCLIKEARLVVVPWARFCLPCQSLAETAERNAA